MRVILWRGGFFGEESASFFHSSDKGSFHIRLLAFGRFRDVSHHNNVFDWMNWFCALVLSVATVVFAARTFIFWMIIHDMSKKVAEVTGVVMVFRLRAIDRVKAFVFGIPEGPFESALVVEQH